MARPVGPPFRLHLCGDVKNAMRAIDLPSIMGWPLSPSDAAVLRPDVGLVYALSAKRLDDRPLVLFIFSRIGPSALQPGCIGGYVTGRVDERSQGVVRQ